MNVEIKKIVSRVKTAQAQLQNLIKDQSWIDDARKYAERQGREAKKLFAADVVKVKTFLGRESKELSRFQKQIPAEMRKLRKFVNQQKKEFGKMLLSVRKSATPSQKASTPSKKRVTKKTAAKATATTTTQNSE